MNQQIDLEFIQKPIVAHFSLTGLFILLASFWFALFTWQMYQQQRISLAETTINLRQMNKQLPQQEIVEPDVAPISSAQLTQLTDDINLLTTPWNELLDAIEQSDMPDIALLSLDPSVKKQQVVLIGESKNLATILQYINKLTQQKTLSQVYLLKHKLNETSNEKPVSFSIIAKWNSASNGTPK